MPKSTPSTQKFVPIKDIRENVVLLKNGQLCMILLASSINFALKSEDEQRAILAQFQSFLNTLDFSLQIYIQSRRLNIDPYISHIQAQEEKQYNDLMRIQLREYIDFIRQFTNEVEVMTKNFFVVVPYMPSIIDSKQGISKLLGNSSTTGSKKSDSFTENRSQLEQRVNIVEQGLNRLGIRTAPLANEELVELYYHIFNPRDVTHEAPKKQA